MTQVKNILVGIDLSQADRLVAADISTSNRHAIEKALWLAEHTGAKLTFLSALELSAHTQHLIQQDPRDFSDVDDTALGVLKEFVAQAEQQGVKADCRLAYGAAWHEIITEVLARPYDIVIIGTRNLSSVKRMLMGSTAMKLLRYCPCPVWVTKAESEAKTKSILIATDLTAVGERAVQIGVDLAKAEEAALHIVHAVEYPLERPLRLSQTPPEEIQQYRKEVRTKAEETLKQQLENDDVASLVKPPQVHLSDYVPESAIIDLIKTHNIDLVVMGTVARVGLTRFLVGNTAERILPELPCSVLAVKPTDFVCPVETE